MAQLSFKLPDDLADRLRAKAVRLDRSVSWLLVQAAEQYVSDTARSLATPALARPRHHATCACAVCKPPKRPRDG